MKSQRMTFSLHCLGELGGCFGQNYSGIWPGHSDGDEDIISILHCNISLHVSHGAVSDLVSMAILLLLSHCCISLYWSFISNMLGS